MIFLLLIFGFWVSFSSVAHASERPMIAEAPEPDRVLFIGNSFTYFNNSLHAHVGAIANDLEPEGKDDRDYRALTLSNGRLDEHLLAGDHRLAVDRDGIGPVGLRVAAVAVAREDQIDGKVDEPDAA